MIDPAEIRQKALNQYPAFRHAWLDGVEFFPKTIPVNLDLPDDVRVASKSIESLRNGSKEVRGFGYRIEWEERRSRTLGRNSFPKRIWFDTQDHFLRLIGRETHFETFAAAVTRLRHAFPELEDWLRSHQSLLAEVVDDLDGMLEVVRYMRDHPRPNCFARELPLAVDTKFIGNNERVLREWFDILLPPHAIRADESHFERRYGFRYVEPHVLVRLLDSTLKHELCLPFAEFSLPVATLSALPVTNVGTFIVENKVNLLTLPCLPRTIALGGLGNSVTMFRDVAWLQRTQIRYWGDIDAEGFRILSSLRACFPQVQSFLMEEELLDKFSAQTGPGSGQKVELPKHLTENETRAFQRCYVGNLRLEQEKIPQADILHFIQTMS